ncbi:MAG TPA: hypothetical protein VH142_13330 [Polyangiaceae bacterium]|nr:hypothetical protein [Polyangiaceae bacterium]
MQAIAGASALVRFGIPLLAVSVGALLVAGVRATSDPAVRRWATLRASFAVGAVFALTAVLAENGVLADAARRPPLFMPLMLACLVLAAGTAFSSVGTRLVAGVPLWLLVGAEGFRLPLELVMHRAAKDGVMPVEMSYAGYNFDIVTGATALALALLIYWGHAPRALVVVWNVLGVVLLAIVIGVAGAGLPWVAAFGPDHVNEWVLHFPYVWLPTVLVPAALFGHLLVFRRLPAENAPRKGGEDHALGFFRS